MKVFIPKNVSKGLFNMSIQVGPFTISVIQLITVAIGLWVWLGVFNTLYQNWVSRVIAAFIAIPLLLLFVFIAFFRYSELSLLPFIAKMIQTYFLDVTKKYQIVRHKPDPLKIVLQRSRSVKHEQVIKTKELVIDDAKMKRFTEIIE